MSRTAEEYFCNFWDKYGEDFDWAMVEFSNRTFVRELERELGSDQPNGNVFAVARCLSNDDVLYLFDDDDWRIYHLTYSSENEPGYPVCRKFGSLDASMAYIEKLYLENRED